MIKSILFISFTGIILQAEAQKMLPFKLPDTGQSSSYSVNPGEDSNFSINPLSFTDNGDGTITDNNTGLMWQKTDGGEMTFEMAGDYCDKLLLGGFSDWRLPTSIELFSIHHFDKINPAINTDYFPGAQAEYWWTSEERADDPAKVWVTNAGGGIGAHPKTETLSAGGTKPYHVRAVRNPFTTSFSVSHFTDNNDGTIRDNYTGLTWQKIPSPNPMTWEEALVYSKTVSLSGKTDWRLPNIKELQSLNDVSLSKPSFDKMYFPEINSGNFWSSTSLYLTPAKAWDLNVDYGIVSQSDKTIKENVILVRGGLDNSNLNLDEAVIPGGEFEMGDHFDFVDPSHPSDEFPVHTVKVNSFFCSKTETTNQQFLAFLNSAILNGEIEVKNNTVFLTGTSDIVCYTTQFANYYSIGYNGKEFSITDFRANHPMVGVMWSGAVAFCNWLSRSNGLEECYNLTTFECDFTKNGYRLPTEAEWEFSARGGKLDPYFNYPNRNILDPESANLPNSGDPYESAGSEGYPFTTPVAFYDGNLHLKSEYNWPGNISEYQTNNGENGFGLFDMQGNVWEFVNDWYGQKYYSISPYDNPRGPESGFIMPDGKPYRAMRGGNWYNGLMVNGISDGHSRVSNRNPSYYRGPLDPNHPYYHLGFRVVRNFTGEPTGINQPAKYSDDLASLQIYPNPVKQSATISFSLDKKEHVMMEIITIQGQMVENLANESFEPGAHTLEWNVPRSFNSVYILLFQTENRSLSKKIMINQ